MVDGNGRPAGVIVTYPSVIDGSSIDASTYQVPGMAVSMVFASNTNPFDKGSKGKDQSIEKNGCYVVVLLKDDPQRAAKADIPVEIKVGEKPSLDVRIRQVAPVKTISGRTVKPWKKAIKADELLHI